MAPSIYTKFNECCSNYAPQAMIHQAVDCGYISKSYRQVLEEVHVLVAYLEKLNLPPGSRAALLSENRYEWFVAYAAFAALGWVVVPLDPRLSASEWGEILNHAETSVLIFSGSFAESMPSLGAKVPALRHRLSLDSSSWLEGSESYPEIIREGGAAEFTPYEGPEDGIASLLYTSGTTGTPKGVLLSHGNILHNAQRMRRKSDRPGQVTLSILPLNHIYGFIGFLANVLYGQSVLLFPKVDLKRVSQALQDFKPQHIAGVPAFYESLGKSLQRKISEQVPEGIRKYLRSSAYKMLSDHPEKFRRLKKILFRKILRGLGGRIEYLSSGGAPLETRIARFFNLLGLPILEGYGLTETTSIVAANDLEKGHYRFGSVGKVCADSQLKIQDPDPKGMGEICVKGPVVMQGYFKNVAETQAIFGEGEWLKTGDVGYLDSDGFLFVTGRSKDVIVTPNGKKIYPREVEKLLGTLPFVKEYCIFGVPQREGSRAEKIHLQMVPDFEEAAKASISDLEQSIKENVGQRSASLPEHFRPQSFGFSAEPFPRTTSLKIKKGLVKSEFLAGKKREAKPSEDAVLKEALGKRVLKLIEPHLHEKIPVHASSTLSLDLGFDSLTLLDFWSSIQEHFHLSIPEEKTLELNDVGAILHFLQASLEKKGNGESFENLPVELKPSKSWENILAHPPPQVHQRATEILQSHPRSRALFLSAFKGIFRTFFRLRIEGLENLPAEGPFILTPNHESYLDNIFVACQLPAKVREGMAVIGAKEFFDHRVSRPIAKLCHTIPLERERFSPTILQLGLDVLKQGKVLLVHPEGTRSPNGELLPLKTGVGMLASFQACPIVPVFLEGAYEFWPKDSRFPKNFGPIKVTVGKAILPEPIDPCAPAKSLLEIAQELTQRLTESLQALREGRKEVPASKAPKKMPRPSSDSEESGDGIFPSLAPATLETSRDRAAFREGGRRLS